MNLIVQIFINMRMINLSAFVALVLVFASCNKELGMENAAKETTQAINPATENLYNATVNGTAVTGEAEAVIAPSSDQLVINAIGNSEEKVSIILPSGVQPGTYDLQFLGDYMATLDKGADNSSLISESGKVTILSRDETSGKVSGTFAFNAANVDGSETAAVTAGTFSVTVAQ